jgi:hypothetical protein
MLSLACFVAVGLVLGFLVPLRTFALFSVVALAAYLALTAGFSGLGRVYDAIFAWIALQIGYFLAVLVYVAWPQLLETPKKEMPIAPKLDEPEQSRSSAREPDSH